MMSSAICQSARVCHYIRDFGSWARAFARSTDSQGGRKVGAPVGHIQGWKEEEDPTPERIAR
eukprot:scaffold1759_cov213-Skeletonema_marinoi.AAC.4